MQDEIPELDWSEQSPHIRSLFEPWQPGDGYDEEALLAAEARLLPGGARLPATLRSFYRAWGRRSDLTQMNEHLLAPEQWVVHSGALIFCLENQACAYWAVPLVSLAAADPPVLVADAGTEPSLWEVEVELDWRPSHPRVSAFLDGLAYLHAFGPGGAVHGAWSERLRLPPERVGWLERDWGKVTWINPQLGGGEPPAGAETLYVRDGLAVEVWTSRVTAVAKSAEALDQVAHGLGLAWKGRW
jgi:hypothetical protein